jgi:hypothetical protein
LAVLAEDANDWGMPYLHLLQPGSDHGIVESGRICIFALKSGSEDTEKLPRKRLKGYVQPPSEYAPLDAKANMAYCMEQQDIPRWAQTFSIVRLANHGGVDRGLFPLHKQTGTVYIGLD